MRDFALGALSGALLLLVVLWASAGLDGLRGASGSPVGQSEELTVGGAAIERNTQAIEALASSLSSLSTGVGSLRDAVANMPMAATPTARRLDAASSPDLLPQDEERNSRPKRTSRRVATASWPSQGQAPRLPHNVKSYVARFKDNRVAAVQELFMATPVAVVQKLGAPDDCAITSSGHMVWRYYSNDGRNVQVEFYEDRVLRVR